MNLAKVLKVLFPSSVPNRDYVVAARPGRDAEIISWSLDAPQPTPEQIAAAWAEIETLQTLRSGLISAWESTFTAGEKALLQSVYSAAIRAFDSGDVAGAKAIIQTIPADISATLATKQAAILSLFPE